MTALGAPLPTTFAASRDATHAIAEMVLATARFAHDGEVGLRPWPGGLATPPLGADGPVFAILGTELVRIEARRQTSIPVTTLAAAGEFVGVTPQVPGNLWRAETRFALEDPLPIDANGAAALADWYRFVDGVLGRFADAAADDGLVPLTLWPEHFDLATNDGSRANYGGSPGDALIAEPYLYVGPWARPLPDADNPYWGQAFGAVLPYAAIASADAAVDFLLRGRQLL